MGPASISESCGEGTSVGLGCFNGLANTWGSVANSGKCRIRKNLGELDNV